MFVGLSREGVPSFKACLTLCCVLRRSYHLDLARGTCSNFGQSRPVAGATTSNGEDPITPETVYVVCADCEKGPVGVRWKAGEPYYLPHSLLAYAPKEGAPVNGALPAGMSEEFVRQLIAQREEQQQGQEGEEGADQPPVIVVEENAVAGSGAEAAGSSEPVSK